jgi:hypothetical protein
LRSIGIEPQQYPNQSQKENTMANLFKYGCLVTVFWLVSRSGVAAADEGLWEKTMSRANQFEIHGQYAEAEKGYKDALELA